MSYKNESSAAARRWQLEHPEQHRLSQVAYRAREREYHCARQMVRMAKQRAKTKGVPFVVDDMSVRALQTRLTLNPICSCCRDMLDLTLKGTPGPRSKSPTLDRLRPSLGYVKGNVAVICWQCNVLKANATSDQLAHVVEWMRGMGL